MITFQKNVSLKTYNTFGIDVNARLFCAVNTVDEVRQLLSTEEFSSNNCLILGGGSNVLFTKDVDGLVIKNNLRGIEVTSHISGHVLVTAASGESWHQLVLWCVAQNYAGIENLSLIPGTVGAAPMQNIGAYGVELANVLHEVEAVELSSGALHKFSSEQCSFGYRDSVFKQVYRGKYFITSVTLKLTDLNKAAQYQYHINYGDVKAKLSEMGAYEPTIADISQAVISIRQSKLPDPAQLGNAGSFFKNPVIDATHFNKLLQQYPTMPSYKQTDGTYKIPAGWLIEQCGWKGKVVGNTGSHKQQALVLVNYGNATGAEILLLAQNICTSVIDKFGIHISPEVNVV
ncbi:MAG: UDP-N-acetylmuramate dehydrogenase [Chitinophagales bacterium]|nr:UDP-N-acetylmuramate dehydrogenase [Chitinophagales bacterium]